MWVLSRCFKGNVAPILIELELVVVLIVDRVNVKNETIVPHRLPGTTVSRPVVTLVTTPNPRGGHHQGPVPVEVDIIWLRTVLGISIGFLFLINPSQHLGLVPDGEHVIDLDG